MKKFLKKTLIYMIMTMLVFPASLLTMAMGAQKAKAADDDPVVQSYTLNDKIANASINPGNGDTVKISITADRAVKFNAIDIYNNDNVKVKHFYQTSTFETDVTKVWNGKDSDSAIVPDGIYVVKVQMTDEGDLVSEEVLSNNITVDSIAPVTTITRTPDAATSYVGYTFTVESNDPTAVRYYSYDQMNWVPYTVPVSKSNVGMYTIYAISIDQAQNVSPIVYSNFQILPDTLSPIISPISDITAGDEYTLQIQATDETPLTYSLFESYGPGDMTFAQDAVDPSIFKIKANVNGEYSVIATVTDAADHSTRVRFTFTWAAQYNITSENPTLKLNRATGDGEIIVDPATVNPQLDLSHFYGTQVLEDNTEVERVILQDLTLSIKSMVNGVPVTMQLGSRANEAGDSQITIGGPAGWDGMINLPTLAPENTYTLPTNLGYTPSGVVAIETGIIDGSLEFFYTPARLTFAGQAGKIVGFVNDGQFVEITSDCIGEQKDQLPDNANECKAVSGADLIVITNHFTQFISYESIVTSPVISEVKSSVEDGQYFLKVTWSNTDASNFKFYVNDLETTPVSIVGNTAVLKVSATGDYKVKMKAVAGDEESAFSNEVTATVQAPTVVETVSAPVAVESTPLTPTVTKAKAATNPEPAVENSTQTSTDNEGVIKGDEKKDESEDATNWTPWIILFILIVFAGAATGGYFYWFAGKEDEEKSAAPKKVKVEKKEKVSVTIRSKQSKPNKKSKRW